MYDAVELGLSASLNPAAFRRSTPLELSGFRRYRLKIVQLTGLGPTAVSIEDLPFSKITAQAWELVVLAAAMATATRSVFNFGEGTVNMVNFMGPFLDVLLQNNGADAATYEIELWAQC
jgi:hypothetical protein